MSPKVVGKSGPGEREIVIGRKPYAVVDGKVTVDGVAYDVKSSRSMLGDAPVTSPSEDVVFDASIRNGGKVNARRVIVISPTFEAESIDVQKGLRAEGGVWVGGDVVCWEGGGNRR